MKKKMRNEIKIKEDGWKDEGKKRKRRDEIRIEF